MHSSRFSAQPRTAPRRARLLALALVGALAGAPLGGCSFFAAPEVPRGNRVDADLLKELIPGTSSRADATALLGSPTAHATFDDSVWLYIGSMTHIRIARTQSIINQDVVVLTFDTKGILRTIEQKNLDDAYAVTMVGRATPSPGNDTSFMSQMFGNVGRFSAGAPSQSAGPAGGAPSR